MRGREEDGAQEKYKVCLPGPDSGRIISGVTDAKRGQGFREVPKRGRHWRDVKRDMDRWVWLLGDQRRPWKGTWWGSGDSGWTLRREEEVGWWPRPSTSVRWVTAGGDKAAIFILFEATLPFPRDCHRFTGGTLRHRGWGYGFLCLSPLGAAGRQPRPRELPGLISF